MSNEVEVLDINTTINPIGSSVVEDPRNFFANVEAIEQMAASLKDGLSNIDYDPTTEEGMSKAWKTRVKINAFAKHLEQVSKDCTADITSQLNLVNQGKKLALSLVQEVRDDFYKAAQEMKDKKKAEEERLAKEKAEAEQRERDELQRKLEEAEREKAELKEKLSETSIDAAKYEASTEARKQADAVNQAEKERLEKEAALAAEKLEEERKLKLKAQQEADDLRKAEEARLAKEKADKERKENEDHKAKIYNEAIKSMKDAGYSYDESMKFLSLVINNKISHLSFDF